MSDANDPRIFLVAERSLLAWNRTHVHDTYFGASLWVGLGLMLFSSALIANLRVALAGLALTDYLVLSAH